MAFILNVLNPMLFFSYNLDKQGFIDITSIPFFISEYKESSQVGFNLSAAHVSTETQNKHQVGNLMKKKVVHLSDIHPLVILKKFPVFNLIMLKSIKPTSLF